MRRRSRVLPAFMALALALVPTLGWSGLVFDVKSHERDVAVAERVVTARYSFQNTGNTPVTITAIRSDCSCTTAQLAKKTYASGESGEITVEFEVGSRHGLQKKAVVVATDDPQTPSIVLALTARIPNVLALSHQLLLWKAGESPGPKTLTVETIDTPSIREVRAHTGSARLQVAVAKLTNTRYEITVAPRQAVQDVSEALTVEAILPDGQVKRSNAFVRIR